VPAKGKYFSVAVPEAYSLLSEVTEAVTKVRWRRACQNFLLFGVGWFGVDWFGVGWFGVGALLLLAQEVTTSMTRGETRQEKQGALEYGLSRHMLKQGALEYGFSTMC